MGKAKTGDVGQEAHNGVKKGPEKGIRAAKEAVIGRGSQVV